MHLGGEVEGGGGAGTQLNMCPDLVLKCFPYPSFFPSASFLAFFSASATCLLVGEDFQHPSAEKARRCLGGQTQRTSADSTGSSQRCLALQLKNKSTLAGCMSAHSGPEQGTGLPLFCKQPALLVDNSSMEPAEWDGSKPVVPKLGCGAAGGSYKRGG